MQNQSKLVPFHDYMFELEQWKREKNKISQRQIQNQAIHSVVTLKFGKFILI